MIKVSETANIIDDYIKKGRNEIRTDKLDMSYGELANLYDNRELIIRPEYQRFFRWTSAQRTRFIESILLGFPTPAIFIAENENGVWELVDGLQRVSTVLQFMGLLKDIDGSPLPALKLEKNDQGKDFPPHDGIEFLDLSIQARLSIKRAGCRIEVIKTGSDANLKYEVFERLNTGGSELTPQEVRNCIFRATAPEFIQWIDDLANYKPYKAALNISEYQKNTMYDSGLVLRFFAVKNAFEDFLHEVEPFITEYAKNTIKQKRKLDKSSEEKLFKKTFNLINKAIGEDAWRHYKNNKHSGPFSVYLFESISIGIATNINKIKQLDKYELEEKIINFKQESSFRKNAGGGANTKAKLKKRIEFARDFFSK